MVSSGDLLESPPAPSRPLWFEKIIDTFKATFPPYRLDGVGQIGFFNNIINDGKPSYHKNFDAYQLYGDYFNNPWLYLLIFLGLPHEKLYDESKESFSVNVWRNIVGHHSKMTILEALWDGIYNISKSLIMVMFRLPFNAIKLVTEFLPNIISSLSNIAFKKSWQWAIENNSEEQRLLDDNNSRENLHHKVNARFILGCFLTFFSLSIFVPASLLYFIGCAITSPMQAIKKNYLFGKKLAPNKMGKVVGVALAVLSLVISITFYAALPIALHLFAPQIAMYAALHAMPHLATLFQGIIHFYSSMSQLGTAIAVKLGLMNAVTGIVNVFIATSGLLLPTILGIGKWLYGKIEDNFFNKRFNRMQIRKDKFLEFKKTCEEQIKKQITEEINEEISEEINREVWKERHRLEMEFQHELGEHTNKVDAAFSNLFIQQKGELEELLKSLKTEKMEKEEIQKKLQKLKDQSEASSNELSSKTKSSHGMILSTHSQEGSSGSSSISSSRNSTPRNIETHNDFASEAISFIFTPRSWSSSSSGSLSNSTTSIHSDSNASPVGSPILSKQSFFTKNFTLTTFIPLIKNSKREIQSDAENNHSQSPRQTSDHGSISKNSPPSSPKIIRIPPNSPNSSSQSPRYS